MKTKISILTLAMIITALTSAFSQDTVTQVNPLNAFSFTEYFLMTLSCILLAVIWVLGKTVKNLSEQLR